MKCEGRVFWPPDECRIFYDENGTSDVPFSS